MASEGVRVTRVLKPAGGASLTLLDARLKVLSGPDAGAEREITAAVFTAGAGDDNDLVLRDPDASGRHFEVSSGPAGFLLRDLGSTNGTFVGGLRVEEAYLKPGVKVLAGRTEIEFLLDRSEVEVAPFPADRFGEALGRSSKMREIFGLLEKISPTEATILLTGETGTGKEVVARSIHAKSRRCARPFTVVDCAGVSENLVESELFGHERGAFTGAVSARAGAFEDAAGGTVFLDEVGELPPSLQPKLLRALDRREVKRLGSNEMKAVDFRLIAATNRNLDRETRTGRFREDLYYRLAVVPVVIPPLREHREDIGLLAREFAARYAEMTGKAGETLDDEAIAGFERHDWPGNVRELRNVVERAVYTGCSGLPPARTGAQAGRDAPSLDRLIGLPYSEAKQAWVEAFEKRYIGDLLARHNGNIAAAAREAGMDRKHLREIARRLGLL